MDTLCLPRAARLLALASCLAAPIASGKELVYGEPYGCNGDRFVVAYCRGDSDTGPYVTNPLDNYCNVTYIDRPRRNGFLPEAGVLRGDILQKIVACGGAAAAAPATAQPAAKAATQAGSTTVELPGISSQSTALLRLPETKDRTIVHYVDELPRKPTGQTDVVPIWVLWVYPAGRKEWPGVAAHWVDYRINCQTGSYEMPLMVGLDRDAKPTKASRTNVKGESRKGAFNNITDVIVGIACKNLAPLAGPRLTSTKAAIEDAMKPAPAAAQPAPPAASANPKDATARADALIDAWTAAFNREDYDGALAVLREYTQLYPKDPLGYLFAGMTYVTKGDIDGAERVLLQGQRALPDAPSIYVDLGSLYFKHREDKPRAIAVLRKAVAFPAASMQDLVVAGELLWQADEEKEATEAFRRAVQMKGDPKLLARGWTGFGRSQVKAGRYPQAIAALDEAVRLDPKSADAHRALAWAYEEKGDFAAALPEQEAVARLLPNDGWEQVSLGDAYASLKRIPEAVAAYDRALALAPRDRLARDLLSVLSGAYEKIGRLDRAVEARRTSVATPHDGTMEGIEDKMMRDHFECGELGRLLVAQKRYPDVVRLYLARGDCSGLGDSMGAGSLGIAYQKLGQPEKAIPLLEDKLEEVEEAIKQYEAELADAKLAKDDRAVKSEMLAEYKAEAVLELDALGRAYLASGRAADAQGIARSLQKYDAKLGAQLATEVSASAR